MHWQQCKVWCYWPHNGHNWLVSYFSMYTTDVWCIQMCTMIKIYITCTICIYHSTILEFLKTHHHHYTSIQLIISTLMCNFFWQCPPICKCFYFWDVECLLLLLESWILASSLTYFKFAWKTASLLVVVTAKCCSDLTVLYNDNQHLSLLYDSAIFVPASDKNNWLGHVPPQIYIESYSNVNLCSFLIWRLIYILLHLLGRSQMGLRCPLCLLLIKGNIYQYVPKWFLW